MLEDRVILSDTIRCMVSVELNEFLTRPQCPACKSARTRPTETHATRVSFECSARCGWVAIASLPTIQKQIVYLDTSTISHIARALARGETEGEWIKVYDSLRTAVADDAICCPGSSILEEEGELAGKMSKAIVEISRGLAMPGLQHADWIRDVQLFRALRRFLEGQDPEPLARQDSRDAFYGRVHEWTPSMNIIFNARTPQEWIEARREQKAEIQGQLQRVYEGYESSGVGFGEIQRREAAALGPTIREVGKREIRQKLGLEPTSPGADPMALWFPSTYEKLLIQAKDLTGQSSKYVMPVVDEFLGSDHVAKMPIAHISSTLHAAVAMKIRGPHPRAVGTGDHYDISHLATYVPYVDIFVADAFFAELCNQPRMRIGDPFGCEILPVGVREVEGFCERIARLVAECPQVALKRRIRQSIRDGGATEDFIRRATGYLKARGAKLPSGEGNA